MDTTLTNDSLDELSIAIIGMSCRFPGANNVDEFWQNLRDGVESVSFFSNEELIAEGIDASVLNNPNYVKARAVVADIENFDASFFGFTPRETEVIDPQQRLFLECAWNALESAGYNSQKYDASIGVFAGVGMNTYLLKNLISNPDLINSLSGLQISIGNDKDFVPTQASYKLNLKGPSVNVNTACSSSLVAVQMACQNLLNYQCDMALAGGVSVNVPQKEGYLYQEGSIVSPDGHCRAFDADAKGCIDGSGAGIVVLKRLQDALADGDNICAVIRGSAINNDGSLKVGYTAPSIEGQSAVISEAQAISGVDVDTITYVETHGTATVLGDPIEVAALTQAFRHSTDKKGFCGIGSVKTNIGHLGAAAGVASLIKTVLALKHKQIPPSLNFNQPSPKIDFANSPFYVNSQLKEWGTNGNPRRAGVSSFGIGGTNAHLVLEEAPSVTASEESRPYHILKLSAKTSSALETATTNLIEHLKQHPNTNLADVAYTLQVGRQDFNHRRAVVCSDVASAIVALQDPKQVLSSVQENTRPVAFMFTGVGTQYVNMAQELYQLEPVFKESIDSCCEIINPLLGEDLRDILYPKSQEAKSKPSAGLDLRKMLGRNQQADTATDAATEKLNQTRYTQPIMFAIEYALAQLWQSWGIQPTSMIGYSIGEYVAATLAGVFSLEEALKLVVTRALMIEELPGGAMLAVPLSEAEVQPLLNEKLSISAITGEKLCVIAGNTEAIEELATKLTTQKVVCRRLQTSHAFHSHMMEPLALAFTEMLQTFNLQAPSIPFVSNVTGTWITPEQATDASYWTKHLCQAVRFASGIKELHKTSNPILLEIGPGQTLGSLALQCLDGDVTVLPSLGDSYNQQSDLTKVLSTLAKLWLWGVEIDWSGFYNNQQLRRIPLPTYPFERQRYWVEAKNYQLPTQNVVENVVDNIITKKSDIADWFYTPSWKRSYGLITKNEIDTKYPWLIFASESEISYELTKRLKDEGAEVIIVRDRNSLQKTQSYAELKIAEFDINPQQSSDYDDLVQHLSSLENAPKNIVHLWSVTADTYNETNIESFSKAQDKGYYSLLLLTQALAKHNYFHKVQLTVISNNIQEVTGTEVLCPEKSTLIGAITVIPQEYRNITCRSVDIVLPTTANSKAKLVGNLFAEITAKSSDLVVAYRDKHRWVQNVEQVKLDLPEKAVPCLKKGGVYLITGGLGGVGLILAEHLAKTVQAKLILTGRSNLSATQQDEATIRKIRKLQELEELGASILVQRADVASYEQMQAVIATAEAKFGKINGVIHAAGIIEGNSISAIAGISKTECEVQFQPKVYGTLVLERLFRDKELDFCMVTSSLSTVLGGLEFFGYVAANVFLDAFVRKLNQKNSTPWMCINWENWLIYTEEDNYPFGATVADLSITVEEGLQVFNHILSLSEVNQLILSTGDLQARINQWVKLDSKTEQTGLQHTTLSHHPRPNLPNAYVAPSNEIEQQLVNVWQELLGIENVGVHDNFFELGGHSLLGTQVISRMREIFEVNLPLRSLFEQPTVAEIAKFIETNRWVARELPGSTLNEDRVQVEL
jgi:acyl transferase domain-containing protein/acyl carrier protein